MGRCIDMYMFMVVLIMVLMLYAYRMPCEEQRTQTEPLVKKLKYQSLTDWSVKVYTSFYIYVISFP